MNAIEAQEAKEAEYENALQLQTRPRCSRCDMFYDWHKDGFALRNAGCPLTPEEVLADPRPTPDPFSDEALGQRTPEAIAQDDRQAADFGGHDPIYHAALVVICEEQGAGRYARAINLVAKIWGKTTHEVMSDAVSL